MDISIITSLYRSESFLPTYCNHLESVAKSVYDSSKLTLEVMLICNDATPDELAILQSFKSQAPAYLIINIIHTVRESLYASWNRGIEQSTSGIFTIWNVDDERYASALVEGYEKIRAGYELVDFPFTEVIGKRAVLYPALYTSQEINPKKHVGPFFMASMQCYEKVGRFDERFRVVGDFHWGIRAGVHGVRYAKGYEQAGRFINHGGNLSSNSNDLTWIELNIILIWYGEYRQIRPVKPDLMKKAWFDWGYTGGDVPPEIALLLWGDGAEARYEAWLRESAKREKLNALRTIPKRIIDNLGLRPLLFRLGIVKSGI